MGCRVSVSRDLGFGVWWVRVVGVWGFVPFRGVGSWVSKARGCLGCRASQGDIHTNITGGLPSLTEATVHGSWLSV